MAGVSTLSPLRVGWLVGALLVAGCASPSHEPPNLDPLKTRIRAYYSTGEYQREIAAVAARTQAWVVERAARRTGGERLAIVFDLDETLLTNWPELSANDFGYVAATWDVWLNQAHAPAIDPVREVYRAARRAGVDVLFITGRTENYRGATVRNLQAIDCTEYAALVCKPDDQGAVGAFKATARERLTKEGYVIVANIGDQESDLTGGFAERTFKLPDPFYIVK
jgi:acid phosphatase